MGGESEDDEDDGGIDQAEIDQNVKKEHVFPVIEWLGQQPKDKKHVVKITNLPR